MLDESTSAPLDAVWQTLSNEGEPAHFYHANGFPVGVYAPLLDRLGQRFSLSTLAMRPTWPDVGPPPKRRDWGIYAEDLVDALDRHADGPIVGIGHSMGATATALAASMRPDLFKALVLIEPAMVSMPVALLAKCIPKWVMTRVEPAKGTLRKVDMWASRDLYVESQREHRAYKRFDDAAWDAMAQGALRETEDGRFQLRFSKIWEAHNYTQAPDGLAIFKHLEAPCVAIRGKPSVFLTEALWKRWRGLCPATVFLENPANGHLFPLENPRGCFDLIRQGMDALDLGG